MGIGTAYSIYIYTKMMDELIFHRLNDKKTDERKQTNQRYNIDAKIDIICLPLNAIPNMNMDRFDSIRFLWHIHQTRIKYMVFFDTVFVCGFLSLFISFDFVSVRIFCSIRFEISNNARKDYGIRTWIRFIIRQHQIRDGVKLKYHRFECGNIVAYCNMIQLRPHCNGYCEPYCHRCLRSPQCMSLSIYFVYSGVGHIQFLMSECAPLSISMR